MRLVLKGLNDAGYLLQRPEELEQALLKRTSWHRRRSDTRHCVLQDLQKKLQPDLLLSDARLEALLEQALQGQVQTLQALSLSMPDMSGSLYQASC